MEELMTLKSLLQQGRVAEAIDLVEELEEMSKSDKLNKIFSYAVILLMHLIKQSAEQRTTRSGDVSIRNAVKQIQRVNQRPKAAGTYLTPAELQETLQDAYELAVDRAALEAFEGCYESHKIAEMVSKDALLAAAIDRLLAPSS